ncbi:cytochrome b N-terminal domain-containing protein [Thiothrix litoralis]|jgi:ubiquinol-cytochrome c reductase cytochrome b subunit|uniref:Cytochrome b n=1 Tax=Thiothrix litoralis TaxID=2891210 RepID=A0ABX7WWK8_9GAMM|nr:cytochrome b N-terminal domain-containing protein [Thiothrix litoralis]QTR46773.1 cytochrome b N-terminal domain-containing protein [Thiothrix litoralis]
MAERPAHNYKGFLGWVEDRFPMMETWQAHLAGYYAPKNFNFWYFFGSLAMLVLVIQIFSGLFLAFHYKPDTGLAFASVEYIMRDVPGGWFIRYMHSTGASAFFIVVYLHMFRALIYGSYKGKRELIWLIGMAIYLALMATAFMGYLLPWGQMSYWGAQVIINLFNTIPVIGEGLSTWIRGDFVLGDATLNRFFALHFFLPSLVLPALVFVHIVALHAVGSNNPDGVEIKQGPKGNRWSETAPTDGIPFHPYYSVKDILGVIVFLIGFFAILFFVPEGGGYFLEQPNFEPANAMKTPLHIAPVWYFTPFYTVLRAIPDPFFGTLAMFAAIAVLFVLPWIDRNPVKSWRYRTSAHKINLILFAVVFLVLGWMGVEAVTPAFKELGTRMTQIYFIFFVVLWIHSNPSKAKYVMWFGILLAAIIAYDFTFRVPGSDPEALNQMLIQAIWPVGYLALTLLLPAFKASCNEEKPVPDRVTG